MPTPSTPNLTREAKLVLFADSLDPLPNHSLVVYKVEGNGRTFFRSFLPGQRPKLPLLRLASTYVAFAVPDERDLRLPMTVSCETYDQVHKFDLILMVEYGVADPAALVAACEKDPLRLLQSEIELVVQQTLKQVQWSWIEQEPRDLEISLFEASIGFESNLERLQAFARRYGLGLTRIQVRRRLDEAEVVVAKKVIASQREAQLLTLKQGTDELEQVFDHTNRGRENAFERREAVSNAAAAALGRAIGQVADGIRTLPALKATVQEVAAMQGGLSSLAAGGAVGSGLPGQLSGLTPATQHALPPTVPASTSAFPRLQELLLEILARFGELACTPEHRRQVISVALHAVAEAFRAEDADLQALDEATQALRGDLDSLISALDQDQAKLLKKLSDPNFLLRTLE